MRNSSRELTGITKVCTKCKEPRDKRANRLKGDASTEEIQKLLDWMKNK